MSAPVENPIDTKSSAPLWLLPAVAVVWVLLETIAYFVGGVAAGWVARLWLLGGALYSLFFLVQVSLALRRELRQGYPQIIAALLVFVGIGWLCFREVPSNDRAINAEASLQVAAGLRFYQRPDLNYIGTGFIGYPARQYLLAAIPSLSGTSEYALRLAFVIPFFTGLLMLYAGMRNSFFAHSARFGWPLLAVLAVTSFPFCGYVFLTFEQSIFPISLCLHATGCFLLVVNRSSWPNLFALAWVGGLLACSYTPGIAAWLLLLLALGDQLLRRWKIGGKWQELLPVISVFLVIACVGALSFKTRTDFFNGGSELLREAPLHRDLPDALRMIVWHSSRPFLPLELLAPCVLYALWALFAFAGWRHAVVVAWSFGVILAAVIVRGYAPRTADVDLHRALVVLPPFVTGLTFVAVQLYENIKIPPKLGPVLLCIVAGLLAHRALVGFTVLPDPLRVQDRFVRKMLRYSPLVASDKTEVRLIAFYGSLVGQNPGDVTAYFFPNARVVEWNQEKPLHMTPEEGKAAFFYVDKSQAGDPSKLLEGGSLPEESVDETDTGKLFALNATGLPRSELASIISRKYKDRIRKLESELRNKFSPTEEYYVGNPVDEIRIDENPAELQREFLREMIRRFIVNSEWSWRDGLIQIRSDGFLDSSWGRGSWKLQDDGTFLAIFPRADFTHQFQFADDMSSLKSVRNDRVKIRSQFVRMLSKTDKKLSDP